MARRRAAKKDNTEGVRALEFPTVEIREDGSLYYDISIEQMGFMLYTPIFNFPINYDSTLLNQAGQVFVSIARSTCPVDTGYLRDNNDYKADGGGVEMWSLAPYSVYQEYGTSLFRAQPWFEMSTTQAVQGSDMWEQFSETQRKYIYVDSELSIIKTATPSSVDQCYYWINRCYALKSYILANKIEILGIIGLIDQTIVYFMELAEEIEMIMAKAQADPVTALIAAILIMIVVALIMFFIEILFDQLPHSSSRNEHIPTH